jgi:hypothetical protein
MLYLLLLLFAITEDFFSGHNLAFEHSKNIVLTQDQVLFAFELDLAAGVLAKQDAIARLNVWGKQFSILGHFALAHRHDSAFLWFFLGGIGDNDSSLSLFFFLNPPDENSIA